MNAETWWGKLRERHHLGNLDGSIIAKWIFKTPLGKPRWEHNSKMDLQEILWQTQIGLIWHGIRTSGGSL